MAETPATGAARFSCPPNFSMIPPTSDSTRLSLEALMGQDTDLWFIRAPLDFSPDCLNGRLVPLSGSQMVKGKLAGKRHRYRVLSSSGAQAEATLLVPSLDAGGNLTCAPAPQGSLSILEDPQGSLSGTPLQPIPTSLPPQIPPGLRPRFCAFGGSPPVTGPASASALRSPASVKKKKKKKKKRHMPEASVPQDAVDGPGTLDIPLGSLEMDEKNKKKKEQLNSLEGVEPVTTESGVEMLEPQEGLSTLTTKKRKKKSKEAGPVEPEVGLLEPEEEMVTPKMVVKTEPLEDTVLSPKKRRQKGTEEMELAEERITASQLQIKMELQEAAIPLPPSKKKKKREKELSVTTELGTVTQEAATSLLEHHGVVVEPALLPAGEPQAQAALGPTTKKRKREKKEESTVDSGAEMMEPREELVEAKLPDAREPQAFPAATKKKRRKERGHTMTVTEPGPDTAGLPEERMQLEFQDWGEPEAGAALEPTKKKRKRDQESGLPETTPQEEVPESGEVVPTKREKKRKKQLQQDPM